MANEIDLDTLDQSQLLALAKQKQERNQLLEQAKLKFQRDQAAQNPVSTPGQEASKAGEAAIEGFGKQATLGYLPQLQAVTGQAVKALTPKSQADTQLEQQGFNVKPGDESYTQMRDTFTKRGQQLQQENPKSYGAGAITGTVASIPMVGKVLPAAPAAATTLGRVGQAAKAGGLIGAVSAPESKEGEIEPIQPFERLMQAGVGAIGGAAAQGLVTGAGVLGEGAKKLAETKAFKSSGAMLKDFRNAFGKNKVEDLGRFMIDNDMTAPGSTFDTVAQKSAELKQKTGQAIGQIYDSIKQKLSGSAEDFSQKLDFLNPDELKSSLQQVTSQEAVRPQIGGKGYDRKMSQIINDVLDRDGATKIVDARIAETPGLAERLMSNDPNALKMRDDLISKTQHAQLSDPRYLNNVISEIDARINWNKRIPDMDDVERGLVAMRRFFRDKVNQVVDVMGNTLKGDAPASEALKSLNRQYGNATEINKISSDRVARINANRAFSPSDYGAAGIGAVIGSSIGNSPEERVKHAIMGMGLGLANKSLRLYGNPLLIRGLDSFYGLPSANPQLTGIVGGKAAVGLMGNNNAK